MNIDYKQYMLNGGKPRLIVPQLEQLLQDVAHKIPAIAYEALLARVRVGAEPDTRINAVSVFNGYEHVGSIKADNKVYRDGTSAMVFSIQSKNITKARGDRDTKQTKHIKVAISTAIAAFFRQPQSAVADQLRYETKTQMERMVSAAESHVRGVFSSEYLAVAQYLYDVNSLGPAPLPHKLANKLGSHWPSLCDNLRIAHSVDAQFRANNGVVARIERDGTINVADLSTTQIIFETKSTYDLPTYYQEKLTMLKILDAKQPVEHVGVRFLLSGDVNVFFMVAGETVTTC